LHQQTSARHISLEGLAVIRKHVIDHSGENFLARRIRHVATEISRVTDVTGERLLVQAEEETLDLRVFVTGLKESNWAEGVLSGAMPCEAPTRALCDGVQSMRSGLARRRPLRHRASAFRALASTIVATVAPQPLTYRLTTTRRLPRLNSIPSAPSSPVAVTLFRASPALGPIDQVVITRSSPL
jgi:hypothetical protein